MACPNCGNCQSQDCGTEIPDPPCPPECPDKGCTPYEYTCGDWRVKVDSNGCVVRERVSNNVPDGVFTNPTITILDGCIAQITSGSRVIQQRPEPCQGSTPQPPVEVGLTLNPSLCNLLSGSSASLLGSIVFDQTGENISVTGCGTPASPLTLSYTGPVPTPGYVPTFVNGVAVQTPIVTPVTSVQSSTLAVTTSTTSSGTVTVDTTGANYTNCGIDIEDGLVKTFTDVVLNVTGSPGITVTNGFNCSKNIAIDYAALDYTTIQNNLDVSNQSKVLVGYTCGSAFINPAVSSPPAGPASVAHGTAVVYGSRVYVMTDFAANVYNSSGSLITTSPGFVSYGTPAAAAAALGDYYTFSGLGSC